MATRIVACVFDQAEKKEGVRKDKDQALIFWTKAYPLGLVSMDCEGEICIEWVGPLGEVRLILPVSDSLVPYVYYASGSAYGIDNLDDPQKLRALLKSMTANDFDSATFVSLWQRWQELNG